ncbi:MAG: hypothetical protein Q8M29_11480 [Bacteroidota bacterium]|nr:hypothetical protein [Bacteroidota bacterium]
MSNKKGQAFSYAFLIIILFDLVRPYTLAAAPVPSVAMIAQGGPVAASAADYVDPFTGDFHYSVPLMSVPGPNGENVPITASYNAGIRMNQAASWIGLGWDFNPGEISRQVNGTPDDNNGKVNFSSSCGLTIGAVTRDDNALYGPMYYNAAGTPNYSLTAGTTTVTPYTINDKRYVSHDAFMTKTGRFQYTVGGTQGYVNLPFASADYDNYSVSGAGIGGALQPYAYSTIKLKWEETLIGQQTPADGLSTGSNNIKPLQFYFSKSADVTGTTVESTTNRIKTGYFVKYLTNTELNNETTNDAVGFIDYRPKPSTGDRRPSADFEGDGIGAYQITTPAGVTYHYSLPVYTSDEQFVNFGRNNSASDLTKRVDISRKRYKYASSWKLTAITGSDYIDDGDNIVDEDDKGYWVAYDYALWNNDYQWSSNMYGFRKDFLPRQWSMFSRMNGKLYEQRASVSTGSSQQYYLNKIKTATHSAFFVKSIRKDEQSMDHLYNSANSAKPQLKLDRIVLLRNEDASLFDPSTGSITAVTGYTTTGCNTNSDIIHDGTYTANLTNINNASLKSVEFVTDYSLCKKYYPNIASTVTSYPVDFTVQGSVYQSIISSCNVRGTPCIAYSYPSAVSTSTSDELNAGGKLTLNKIKVYELGKVSVYPSYDFAYTTNNPDYDCDKTDLWGFYKSDYDPNKRSYYTTSTSKANVDAWSLKTITTPLGGKLNVTYESDEYKYEGGFGLGNEAHFTYLLDGVAGGHDAGGNTANFSNEPDYVSSCLRARTVIQASASCTGVFYYGEDEYGVEFDTPDPYYDQNCTVNLNYSPTNALTEWAWTKRWFSLAYGGGIRVKDIVVEDPESEKSYKLEYTYANGVCTYKPEKFYVGDYSLTDNPIQNDRDNIGSMVGYQTVNTKTISNNGHDNGKTEFVYNVNYTPSKMNAVAYNPEHHPHQTPYWRDNCTYYLNQYPTIDLCRVWTSETVVPFAITRLTGTFGLFGKLERKSVYDKTNVLLAYTKNNYKTVSEIQESFTKDDQKYTEYNSFAVSNVSLSYQTGPVLPVHTPQSYSTSVSGGVQFFKDSITYKVLNNVTLKQYSVLDKTESFANGITTVSKVNERDPISMQPLSSTMIDPTQGAITTTIKPAYTNTVSYSGMGLKSACSTCSGNENMVSLVEEQRTIKQPVFRNTDGELTYNSSSPGILMGASKQTYASTVTKRKFNTTSGLYESASETANTWLPYESYSALTTASTPSSTTTPEWKKTNTITVYNTLNKALETEGMSGRKSAVKYGYNNLYPLASISDANYNCFTFSSFEDKINVGTSGTPVWHFGGEVKGGVYQQAASGGVAPHTGYYMAAVPTNTFGPGINLKGFETGRSYRASVWVHKNSPNNAALCAALDGSVGGTGMSTWYAVNKNDAANITVGNWILMSLQIEVPEGYVESGGTNGFNNLSFYVWNTGTTTAYYDDLMVRPVDAPITGTVYDPVTARVMSTLDNENFASYFEYDAAGRVTKTYKETRLGVKKISETQYNFSRQ